jgi:hypothetical protein
MIKKHVEIYPKSEKTIMTNASRQAAWRARRIDEVIQLKTELRALRNAERVRALVFSKQEFQMVLAALHSDSRLSLSNEKLTQAFRIFNDRKLVLLKD